MSKFYCQNQHDKNNEIVVVVDGTYDLNKGILEKYKSVLNLKPIIFDTNQGFNIATNYGFYNASQKYCFTINDDNVVGKDFDSKLLNGIGYISNFLIVPNQIEPKPSMFPQFVIKDLGQTFDKFNLDDFNLYEDGISKNKIDLNGWTYPMFISRYDFLRVGGLDIMYPGSYVSDWDLFTKLELSGIISYRTYRTHVYHFGSMSARTPQSYDQERQAHEYYKTKWGVNSYHDPQTNSKLSPYLLETINYGNNKTII